VPVEWPIAPARDGGPVTARPAGSGRLSCARIDFFLDSRKRLTEQERALMTAMYADLVASLADEFIVLLADAEPANDDGERLFDRLWDSGLLDIPSVVRLLLRRAEEERISAGIHSGRQSGKTRLLQSLVSDEDPDLSAAAMALILARGRRRDRFDGSRLNFDDLPAEAADALVNAIAAALRADLARRFDPAGADERLSAAARALLARHDEGNRLEARIFDLVHAADRAGRLDEARIRSALAEGEAAFLAEALARRSGIGFEAAWDHLTGAFGKLALLLRMSRIPRDMAGEIIGSLAEVIGSDAEAEISAYDDLTDDRVESARQWLRLDPFYRSAVESLGSDDGQRAL